MFVCIHNLADVRMRHRCVRVCFESIQYWLVVLVSYWLVVHVSSVRFCLCSMPTESRAQEGDLLSTQRHRVCVGESNKYAEWFSNSLECLLGRYVHVV